MTQQPRTRTFTVGGSARVRWIQVFEFATVVRVRPGDGVFVMHRGKWRAAIVRRNRLNRDGHDQYLIIDMGLPMKVKVYANQLHGSIRIPVSAARIVPRTAV